MNLNPEGLEILKGFSADEPVFMLNYLNYKDIVEETGKTGQETYKEYMAAAMPFFAHVEADIIFKGKPQAMILGPSDENMWDEVLIVKYANKYEFFKLSQMKDYPFHIRAAALSDSRLIFCK